jgi:hypothetical protein
MNPSNQSISQTKQSEAYCTKKIETPVGSIENSYLCDQSRFTSADLWKMKKQKREFPQKELNVIFV